MTTLNYHNDVLITSRKAREFDERERTLACSASFPDAVTYDPTLASTMICYVCDGVLQHRNGLLSNSINSDGHRIIKMVHHRTARSLQDSVVQGCYICRLLWDDLSDVDQEALKVVSNRATLKERQRRRGVAHREYQHLFTECFLERFDVGYLLTIKFSEAKKSHTVSGYFLSPISSLPWCPFPLPNTLTGY